MNWLPAIFLLVLTGSKGNNDAITGSEETDDFPDGLDQKLEDIVTRKLSAMLISKPVQIGGTNVFHERVWTETEDRELKEVFRMSRGIDNDVARSHKRRERYSPFPSFVSFYQPVFKPRKSGASLFPDNLLMKRPVSDQTNQVNATPRLRDKESDSDPDDRIVDGKKTSDILNDFKKTVNRIQKNVSLLGLDSRSPGLLEDTKHLHEQMKKLRNHQVKMDREFEALKKNFKEALHSMSNVISTIAGAVAENAHAIQQLENRPEMRNNVTSFSKPEDKLVKIDLQNNTESPHELNDENDNDLSERLVDRGTNDIQKCTTGLQDFENEDDNSEEQTFRRGIEDNVDSSKSDDVSMDTKGFESKKSDIQEYNVSDGNKSVVTYNQRTGCNGINAKGDDVERLGIGENPQNDTKNGTGQEKNGDCKCQLTLEKLHQRLQILEEQLQNNKGTNTDIKTQKSELGMTHNVVKSSPDFIKDLKAALFNDGTPSTFEGDKFSFHTPGKQISGNITTDKAQRLNISSSDDTLNKIMTFANHHVSKLNSFNESEDKMPADELMRFLQNLSKKLLGSVDSNGLDLVQNLRPGGTAKKDMVNGLSENEPSSVRTVDEDFNDELNRHPISQNSSASINNDVSENTTPVRRSIGQDFNGELQNLYKTVKRHDNAILLVTELIAKILERSQNLNETSDPEILNTVYDLHQLFSPNESDSSQTTRTYPTHVAESTVSPKSDLKGFEDIPNSTITPQLPLKHPKDSQGKNIKNDLLGEATGTLKISATPEGPSYIKHGNKLTVFESPTYFPPKPRELDHNPSPLERLLQTADQHTREIRSIQDAITKILAEQQEAKEKESSGLRTTHQFQHFIQAFLSNLTENITKNSDAIQDNSLNISKNADRVTVLESAVKNYGEDEPVLNGLSVRMSDAEEALVNIEEATKDCCQLPDQLSSMLTALSDVDQKLARLKNDNEKEKIKFYIIEENMTSFVEDLQAHEDWITALENETKNCGDSVKRLTEQFNKTMYFSRNLSNRVKFLENTNINQEEMINLIKSQVPSLNISMQNILENVSYVNEKFDQVEQWMSNMTNKTLEIEDQVTLAIASINDLEILKIRNDSERDNLPWTFWPQGRQEVFNKTQNTAESPEQFPYPSQNLSKYSAILKSMSAARMDLEVLSNFVLTVVHKTENIEKEADVIKKQAAILMSESLRIHQNVNDLEVEICSLRNVPGTSTILEEDDNEAEIVSTLAGLCDDIPKTPSLSIKSENDSDVDFLNTKKKIDSVLAALKKSEHSRVEDLLHLKSRVNETENRSEALESRIVALEKNALDADHRLAALEVDTGRLEDVTHDQDKDQPEKFLDLVDQTKDFKNLDENKGKDGQRERLDIASRLDNLESDVVTISGVLNSVEERNDKGRDHVEAAIKRLDSQAQNLELKVKETVASLEKVETISKDLAQISTTQSFELRGVMDQLSLDVQDLQKKIRKSEKGQQRSKQNPVRFTRLESQVASLSTKVSMCCSNNSAMRLGQAKYSVRRRGDLNPYATDKKEDKNIVEKEERPEIIVESSSALLYPKDLNTRLRIHFRKDFTEPPYVYASLSGLAMDPKAAKNHIYAFHISYVKDVDKNGFLIRVNDGRDMAYSGYQWLQIEWLAIGK